MYVSLSLSIYIYIYIDTHIGAAHGLEGAVCDAADGPGLRESVAHRRRRRRLGYSIVLFIIIYHIILYHTIFDYSALCYVM